MIFFGDAFPSIIHSSPELNYIHPKKKLSNEMKCQNQSLAKMQKFAVNFSCMHQ